MNCMGFIFILKLILAMATVKWLISCLIVLEVFLKEGSHFIKFLIRLVFILALLNTPLLIFFEYFQFARGFSKYLSFLIRISGIFCLLALKLKYREKC